MRLFSKLILVLLIVTVWPAYGQTEKTSAPVKWQRYSLEKESVSLLLPKTPVKIGDSDDCFNCDSTVLYAYANQAVYSITIKRKGKERIPKECEARMRFGRKLFDKRLEELSSGNKNIVKPTSDAYPLRSFEIATEFSTIRLVDDLHHDQWIELRVDRRSGFIDADRAFLASLRLKEEKSSVQVTDGSSVTLGDADIQPAIDAVSRRPLDQSMTIVHKPRAPWTEEALRSAQLQGTVILRITFLANGSIGLIKTVKGMPMGLTESAIATARKIAFLPQTKNGVVVDVTKQVEFSFSIY
jgi:TonB family protein